MLIESLFNFETLLLFFGACFLFLSYHNIVVKKPKQYKKVRGIFGNQPRSMSRDNIEITSRNVIIFFWRQQGTDKN